MKKKFLLNILLLVFLNLLIKPLWVFIEIEVQNKTGVKSFGLYFALFNLSLILNTILDAGIANFNNKKIAENPELTSQYISRLIPLRILLGMVYIIILSTTGVLLQYNISSILLLCTLGFNQFLLATLMYLRSNLQGMHFFKSDSIVSIADRIIMATLVLYCFYALQNEDFTIYTFAYIQTFGYLFAVLLAALFLFFHSGIKFKPRFSLKFIKAYTYKCFPYALIGILMLVYSFTDTVILERLKGDDAAGIYAQSSRLLLALINFSYLFSVPLLPMFARMIAQKENYHELLRLSGAILILSSIFIAVSCALYAEEIITALYAKKGNLGLTQKLLLSFKGELNNINNPEEILQSSKVFTICILNFIPMSAMYIYGTFLTAAGEMKLLNTSAFLGVLLNLCANLLLIPHFGVEAAAMVSLGTQSFVCIMQIYYARKKYKLQLNSLIVLRYLSVLVLFSAFALLLLHGDFTWILKISLSILFGLTLSILLKAIPLPSISKLFKRN